MFSFQPKYFLAAVISFALIGGVASAATVGVAVDGINSNTTVGTTESRAALGGRDAIKYFIPLSSSATDCVYGAGCGTSSDHGYGGQKMSMFLKFDPVSITKPSRLTVLFEDLDLSGANDPWWFLESLQLFNQAGNPMTALIETIGGLVGGDHDTQQILSLDLGVLPSSPYYLEFKFASDSKYYARNTPEYLIAEISAVPLPAAGLLLIGALGGLGVAARRRKQKTA